MIPRFLIALFFFLFLSSCEKYRPIYFSKHYYLSQNDIDGETTYTVMTNKREELTYPFQQEILEINTSGDCVYWRSVQDTYHILDTKTGKCINSETPPDIKLIPVELYWETHH